MRHFNQISNLTKGLSLWAVWVKCDLFAVMIVILQYTLQMNRSIDLIDIRFCSKNSLEEES